MNRTKELDTTIFHLAADGASGDADLEARLIAIMEEYLELWKQKQRSYGPHNIGMFGAAGCLIRSSDKIQRLRRHYFLAKDVSLSDESIQDSWLDLIGYALMGLMNERGQWPTIS